jgi:protein-arginine kinase activator protein McsA
MGIGGTTAVAPYRLDVVQLDEIRECTVSCPNCQTKISLRLDRMTPIARACPSCNKKFDQDLDGALSGLREAYAYAQQTVFKIEFYILGSSEKSNRKKGK